MISLNPLSLNLFLLLTTSRKPSIFICMSALSLILKKVRGKKEKGQKKKKTPNVNVELSTVIAVSTFQVILDSRSSLKFLKRDKWLVTKKSG